MARDWSRSWSPGVDYRPRPEHLKRNLSIIALLPVRLVCLLFLLAAGLSFCLRRTERAPAAPRMYLARGRSQVQITSFEFSADGKMMALSDSSGRATVRDATTGRELMNFQEFASVASTAVFSPDRTLIAIGGPRRGVLLQSLEPDDRRRSLKTDVPIRGVKALAFSPDACTLAATTSVNTDIVLWDLRAGKLHGTLRGHGDTVIRLAFAPDGRSLAAGGKDHVIMVWDLAGARPRFRLSGPWGPVASLAFSPGGELLASAGGFEDQVRLWDARKGQPHRVLAGHAIGTSSVAFSPDGRLLATGGGDGIVRLWNVSTGRQQLSLDGASVRIRTVAFSPDRRRLAATGNDDDIRLWELSELGVAHDDHPENAGKVAAPLPGDR
jgi:WD40 repeat protein